jgi:transcriptional regulatory protein GAL4
MAWPRFQWSLLAWVILVTLYIAKFVLKVNDVQGSTSGVGFLRCLLDWAGFLHQSQTQTEERRKEPISQLKGVLASSQISHAAITNQIASTLIDAYFNDYHTAYPFVHEATFRAQYHEIIPRPPQRSWDMLCHAVQALGAWSLNNDQIGLEDYLYRRALTLGQHESVFEAANLTSVQALVLLSNLSQKRNSPNTGWNLLGLAVRTALSLALHRELPHWNISLMEREIRRRVWWGLYIFDSGASTTFGRAIMLPDHDSMNVHPVLNIDDEVRSPYEFAKTVELIIPVTHAEDHRASAGVDRAYSLFFFENAKRISCSNKPHFKSLVSRAWIIRRGEPFD